MKKNYTIKDIAILAGVSKGTVDRVLHKRGKVSQIALDTVNSVLDEIDYHPNLIARNLKKNKIHHICVLMPDPALDEYWQPCVQGVKDVIKEFKPFNVSIEIFYFNPESTKSFLKLNAQVLENPPDAILLVPFFHKESLVIVEKYKSLGVIVTTFNNQVQLNTAQGFVGQDLVQSGRVAAKLLDTFLNKGHIAIIHIDEVYKNAIHMQEKEKGFRSYFSALKNSKHTITTFKLKHPDFETSLTKLLHENPLISGLFITTSKVYQVAEKIKKIRHDKVFIVGYDLLDKNIEYLNRGLIDFLLHQNPKQQAYLGITYLIEHFIFEKEIPKTKLLPIDIINSENVKFYAI